LIRCCSSFFSFSIPNNDFGPDLNLTSGIVFNCRFWHTSDGWSSVSRNSWFPQLQGLLQIV
jgi:hypothetical protein